MKKRFLPRRQYPAPSPDQMKRAAAKAAQLITPRGEDHEIRQVAYVSHRCRVIPPALRFVNQILMSLCMVAGGGYQRALWRAGLSADSVHVDPNSAHSRGCGNPGSASN